MPSRKTLLLASLLGLTFTIGAATAPLLAQALQFQQKPESAADERSDWSVFVGNTNNFDNTVWIVRYNRVTGETWFKDGKRWIVVEDPR